MWICLGSVNHVFTQAGSSVQIHFFREVHRSLFPEFRVGGMNSFAVDVDSRTFHLELAALAFGIKHSCKESRLWKTVDGVNIVS